MSNSLPDSDLSAALEAHAAARSQPSEAVLKGEDLTSLNKLLQWSTAHTEGNSQNPTTKSPSELAKDREWLDAAFPDTNADIKRLVSLLSEGDLSVEDTVTALEGLEEVFADLNHAVNIDKLGALDPILKTARSEHATIRATALWALGTALQDLPEVKAVFMDRQGHVVLAERLADEADAVRSKAVRAASALLRHSTEDIKARFEEVGGMAALRAVLADTDVQTRRKARFFLQHAKSTGNEQFVESLLRDRNAVARLAESFAEIDVEDVADVEAAVGGIKMLVETDRQGLLQVAPELPGVVDGLARRCADEELRESLVQLGQLLG